MDSLRNFAHSKGEEIIRYSEESTLKVAGLWAEAIENPDGLMTCSYSSTLCEAFKIAKKLQKLHNLYATKNNLTVSRTELVILFSLGISAFMAGNEEKALFYLRQILESQSFGQRKSSFNRFVEHYVDSTPNAGLKMLLINCFSLLK